MDKFDWVKTTCTLFLICAATAMALPAQTFTMVHSFDNKHGANPIEGLVQATDGNLYGTTLSGGDSTTCQNGCGTVFKITPGGTVTLLHSFCLQDGCPDGDDPYARLVQATDENFYGTATGFGAGNGGTVFKITPGGALTTLYSFCSQSGCADGNLPQAGLVQGTDGRFYGVTEEGGFSGNSSCFFLGCGTVFTITPSGTLTTLHSFDSTDGEDPVGELVQGSDGNLYGTTALGGTASGFCPYTSGCGTVFKITPSGTLTTLYSFCSQGNCTDGAYPAAALVQATDGNFYGTTGGGGRGKDGGTVFKITLSGTLTTLYSFCSQSGCADGQIPEAGLVQATDGNFYGTTVTGGGINSSGTVYKVTPGGMLTTLYSFCSQDNCPDGNDPYSTLVQDTNGNLYGTTCCGGADIYGTVFSVNMGLRPFVKIQPAIGKVGALVRIMGTNLTGATSVSFGGVEAAYTVVSRSFITATVPADATTSKIQVVTPRGTLQSNVLFVVRP